MVRQGGRHVGEQTERLLKLLRGQRGSNEHTSGPGDPSLPAGHAAEVSVTPHPVGKGGLGVD